MNRAVSREPDNPTYYDLLASLYEAKNEKKKAIAVLEKAAVKFENNERILYYLGSLYDKVGEEKKSAAQMEKILKLNPLNANALNYLGYSYVVKKQNMEKALGLIKKAVQIKPKDGYIRDSLGWWYYQSGDFSKALENLSTAIELQPDEAIIYEHLGDTYLKLKESAKARDAYSKALVLHEKAKQEGAIVDEDEYKKFVQKLSDSGFGELVHTRLPAYTPQVREEAH